VTHRGPCQPPPCWDPVPGVPPCSPPSRADPAPRRLAGCSLAAVCWNRTPGAPRPPAGSPPPAPPQLFKRTRAVSEFPPLSHPCPSPRPVPSSRLSWIPAASMPRERSRGPRGTCPRRARGRICCWIWGNPGLGSQPWLGQGPRAWQALPSSQRRRHLETEGEGGKNGLGICLGFFSPSFCVFF